MCKHQSIVTLLAIGMVSWGLSGCGNKQEGSQKYGDLEKNPQARGHHHHHGHEGPHHGDLIELGHDEFHAELVHDHKSNTVTVYILDGEAKKNVPIEAKEVKINIKHEAGPQRFTLMASPESDDPEGQSSRFVSEEEKLAKVLDQENTNASLMVMISGKSYSGKIEHHHDHHGHDDHDHGSHDDHDHGKKHDDHDHDHEEK